VNRNIEIKARVRDIAEIREVELEVVLREDGPASAGEQEARELKLIAT
jgi:hypothetical protein